MLEVFNADLLVKEHKEEAVNGIYRPDARDPDFQMDVIKVEVLDVGRGYYIEKTGEWMPLPYRKGDILIIHNNSWRDIDQKDEEGNPILYLGAGSVIARYSEDPE